MINKKSQVSTDTPIVIGIVAFQAFLILSLGLIEVDYDNQNVDTNFNMVGFDVVDFSQNTISNIEQLGWFNLLLFSPLIIALSYIIAKLIRGGG